MRSYSGEADCFIRTLKHFHLLGYDLAKKGSVVSSFLQSHFSQFNKDMPDKIRHQILSEVQDFNQCAGTIAVETQPKDLIEHFKEPEITHNLEGLTREVAVSEGIAIQTAACSQWYQQSGQGEIKAQCSEQRYALTAGPSRRIRVSHSRGDGLV